MNNFDSSQQAHRSQAASTSQMTALCKDDIDHVSGGLVPLIVAAAIVGANGALWGWAFDKYVIKPMWNN